MEWWEWVTWAVTAAAAGTGPVLGIRAERRYLYLPGWVVDRRGPKVVYVNHTGEDALNVTFAVDGGRVVGSANRTLIRPDEEVEVQVAPLSNDPRVLGSFHVVPIVAWVRARTGKAYRWREGMTRGERIPRVRIRSAKVPPQR